MGMTPIVVTGYTPRYEDHARKLEAMALAYEWDLIAIPYADRGCWMANVQAKAEIVKQGFDKAHRPILWVDADNQIRRKPNRGFWEYLAEHHDAAGPSIKAMGTTSRPRVYFDSVLWFNRTHAAEELIQAWVDFSVACAKPSNTEEHLEAARAKMGHKIRWCLLPDKEYAWLNQFWGPPPEMASICVGTSPRSWRHVGG